jgi:hypothetical protein
MSVRVSNASSLVPKPPGKERDRARFLDEEQLAGEEVLERDQLRIGGDPGIRLLFERQPDIQSEAALAASALLRGAHDPGAGSGDDHPALLHHPPAELPGRPRRRLVRRRARRAKDRDLGDRAVGRENLEGVAQLFQSRARDLEVGDVRTVLVELEDGGNHLREVPARPGRNGERGEQFLDQAIGGI